MRIRLTLPLVLPLAVGGCGDRTSVGGDESETGSYSDFDPEGDACPAGGELRVLAEQQVDLAAPIAVDADTVYYGAEGGVMMVGKDGGEPERLGYGKPRAIALDEDRVYWSTSGGVFSKAKTGGSQTMLASAPRIGGLVARDDSVFYATWSPPQVFRVDKDGGVPELLVTSPDDGPTPALAVSGDRLLTLNVDNIDSGPLWSVAMVDGATLDLAHPVPVVRGLAADDDTAFWSEEVQFESGRIRAVSTAGGDVSTFVEGRGNPFELATDGRRVYWTDNVLAQGTLRYAGQLRCKSKSGGEAVDLADYEELGQAVAVDDEGAYFLVGGSGPSVGRGDVLMVEW